MKVNISIDDVSPHPMSSVKVVERCNDILNIFPDAKFSLFVPMAYWRTVKQGIATSQPLVVSHYPDFISFLESLPERNFELCYHGLFHGIPGKSDNDEFQSLSYEEAIEKFQKMFQIAGWSGLEKKFKPVFRPPAWRMSSHSIKAARDLGIRTLALSPKEYARATYGGEEEKMRDIVYYDCNPPFDPLCRKEKIEIVYHACEWDSNYLSLKMCQELIDFLREERVEFCFMSEMAA